jgi:hypothetical protein
MSTRLTIGLAAALSLGDLSVVASKTPTLDYEFFKTKVEPIFLKKREGHTRCYVCHEESNNAFRLEKLPAGAAFWTEDQSRKNFDTVSALMVPGDPPTVGCSCNHSRPRRAATPSTPAAGNLPLRTTLTGKLWRSGSPVEPHRRSESPSMSDVGVRADIARTSADVAF